MTGKIEISKSLQLSRPAVQDSSLAAHIYFFEERHKVGEEK